MAGSTSLLKGPSFVSKSSSFKLTYSTTPKNYTSGQISKHIIGWGDNQKNAGKTIAITKTLNRGTVQLWKTRGLTKEWVEKQLNSYINTMNVKSIKAPNALNNVLLLPRKALMEKILSLW